jgi:YHS domain-containing protein
MHARFSVLSFLLALCAFTADVPPAAGLPNKFCPVMTDQLAKPKFSTRYRNKLVYFCCADCVKEFEDEPAAYEKNLPWYRPDSASVSDVLVTVGEFMRRHVGAVGAALGCLLAWLIFRRGVRSENPAERTRLQSGALRGGVLAGVLVLGLAVEVYFSETQMREAEALKAKREVERKLDVIHFATFSDHGYPPRIPAPKNPPKMAQTYYRGNDERDDSLYNKGNYLTCTFNLSFQTADGRTLQIGDTVKPGNIFLRVEIIRGVPSLAFFSERMIKSIMLTRSGAKDNGSKPVPDAVRLNVLEKDLRWDARYPIAFTGSETKLEDLVYICQEFKYGKPDTLGSRFHYGLQFVLNIQNGVIQEGSGVWMGALYRTRRLPAWTIPAEEWLGPKPLPIKPKDFDTNDPKLLGLDDYEGVEGSKEPSKK